VNRLWGRVGVRAASVGLLLAGVAGGIYLGHGKDAQQQASQAQLVVQSDKYEMQLLKQRQNEHAAARAYRRQAESDAAAKAAAAAKASATKARELEAKAIAKKEAAQKAAAEAKAAEAAKAQTSSSSSSGTVPYSGSIPSSCESYSGNRATGCALMLNAGFKIDQFPCLDKLWTRESGWNHYASNASTGAYGIPQALPGSKMGTVASDWRTNPATQIKWGLGYIEGRYGTPCSAWSHSQSTGWY
jgi:hypothetical protein